ncbi:MAG: hypothetical protein E7549_08110 [Ruminococcaceae bacterium]|nr:hypothetical protein [Oscillospiraceae bacterium]
MKYKHLLVTLLAVALCVLSGCTSLGTDIALQLRPPKAMGEQGAAEEALGVYIAEHIKREDYTLKYPRSGAYRSAFLMEDIDGDGKSEAIAFYDAENTQSHINLLRQTDGEWHSVFDLAVLLADIHCITFGDMDGDGVRELVVCWDMFSDRTYQVAVYGLNGDRITERFTATSSSVTVTDLTGDGRDDCLLWHADTQFLTASLWSMSAGAVVEVGRVTVDSYVQRLGTPQVTIFEDGSKGVVLDAEKSGDVLVTQLLYWDGDRLVAPFYSEADGANLKTVRPADIPSADVDEDGRWEWPQCTPLVGHGDGGEVHTSTCRLTEFWGFDKMRGEAVKKFSCIYNSADRYYLLTEDTFAEQFTTMYSAADRTLWVRTVEEGESSGKTVFAVRYVPKGDTPPAASENYVFADLVKNGTATYQVWYDTDNDYAINDETLRYMLTVF